MTLHHVALEVRRGDASAEIAFWELLGFSEVPPPQGLRDRARWMQSGPTQIHVLYAEDPVAAPEGHVAVVADDYERTVAALRAAGHEAPARTEHWGSPRTMVRTPAGHRVELMAFTPSH